MIQLQPPQDTLRQSMAKLAAALARLAFPTKFFPIAPSDTADLPRVPNGLFALTSGSLVMMGEDGALSPEFTVTAGQTLPFAPTRVMATGTTASLMGLG